MSPLPPVPSELPGAKGPHSTLQFPPLLYFQTWDPMSVLPHQLPLSLLCLWRDLGRARKAWEGWG